MMVPPVTEEPLGGALPPLNPSGQSSQPLPMPMGMPLSFPGQPSASHPMFLPQQPSHVNAPNMQNSSGLASNFVNLPMSANQVSIGCPPSCLVCNSIRNGNPAGQPLGMNVCPMRSQQNFNVDASQPPMLLPMNTGRQANFATRPVGSSIPGQPQLLAQPTPLGPPSLMNNPPKIAGSVMNPYPGISTTKPMQLSEAHFNPALMPESNSSMGVSMNYMDLNNSGLPQQTFPGAMPQPTGPLGMAGIQPMPMSNPVNDARGSKSLGPLTTAPLPQPSLPANQIDWIDMYIPEQSKPAVQGTFTPYTGIPPPRTGIPNQNNILMGPPPPPPPPLGFRPYTSAGPVARFGPSPQATSWPPPLGPMPLPTTPSAKSEELDLARQFGYININADGIEPPKTPVTPKDLQDAQKDLYPLANAMISGAKPFDNTTTIRDHLVRFYCLQYNWEWMLSLRTHTCTSPTRLKLIIVGDDGEVSTKERILHPNTFPIVEYDKAMREGKYPMFVLTHWGTRDNEPLCSIEYTWSYGDMPKQIKTRKRALFLAKA